jgi:hypothetical protein
MVRCTSPGPSLLRSPLCEVAVSRTASMRRSRSLQNFQLCQRLHFRRSGLLVRAGVLKGVVKGKVDGFSSSRMIDEGRSFTITFGEARAEAVAVTTELKATREMDLMALASMVRRAQALTEDLASDEETICGDEPVGDASSDLQASTAELTFDPTVAPIPFATALEEANDAAACCAATRAEQMAAFERICRA